VLSLATSTYNPTEERKKKDEYDPDEILWVYLECLVLTEFIKAVPALASFWQ